MSHCPPFRQWNYYESSINPTYRPKNMCDPKNTQTFQKFERSGHWLPKAACDYYFNEHSKCYAAVDVAKEVPRYSWAKGKTYDDKCRFCKEGKDIDHAWKYGKGWAEA
ncbi:hypothetical protein E8E11_007921 [Didymella keratinophila]|nr:hypothetical protein E8E11_007921 [Didymella keratinophila]